jgi:hypothetical protein
VHFGWLARPALRGTVSVPTGATVADATRALTAVVREVGAALGRTAA